MPRTARSLAIVLAGAALLAAAPARDPLPSIDREGYAALVGSRDGRVLVVNMWATWCEPCREEFPDLVRLHRELSPRGLDLVAVSLDTASAVPGEVVPFLEAQGARFPVYVKKPGGDDEFINAIDTSWSGALPATFIYDGKGRLIRGIHGRTTFAQVEAIVAPLLRKAGEGN